MTHNIKSRADLRLAIEKLSLEQKSKELKLRENTRAFANQFKPANLIKTAFKSVTGDKEIRNDFMMKGAETLLGFILPGMLLKKSGPFIKVAASVIGSGLAGSLLGGDAGQYIEKAKNLFSKFKDKFKKTEEDGFNEQDLY